MYGFSYHFSHTLYSHMICDTQHSIGLYMLDYCMYNYIMCTYCTISGCMGLGIWIWTCHTSTWIPLKVVNGVTTIN